MTVDLLGSLRSDEGDVLGRESDSWSILFVQFCEVEDPVTFAEIVKIWNLSYGIELRSGDFGEWVEESVVQRTDNEVKELYDTIRNMKRAL